MRKWINKTLSIVAITLIISGTVRAQNQEATAKYLGEVSTGMKNAVEFTNWQGLSITMYSNLNNSLPLAQYWSTSEGFKTGNVPTDENDRFLFRSFTKTLTATIILQLQEEGKVNIDSALSNYIEPVTHVDSTITLRELLSMRANVCNYIDNSWAIIDEDPTRIFGTREILELTIPEGPCNEEKEYDYNDTNFQLLGLVIESVTGKAGEDVFQSRFIIKEDSLFPIQQPWTYGVTPIIVELAPIDVDPHSLNGIWTEDNDVVTDQFGESLNAVLTAQKYSAGVVGRTEDMIRLLAAILTPGQLLSQESLDMMTDIISDDYGLGIQRFDFNDEFSGEDHVLYGHIGAGLNASTTFYNPVRKIGFSFAANLTQQNPGVLLNNLTDVIRNNYERLLNCRLENGCAGMITPNPLKGRVASYQGSGSIQVEYVDWDQRIDTVSFFDDGVVGGEIVFDSLGQGFNIFEFDEMTFVWGLQLGFNIYQDLTDISFDLDNYVGLPNPIRANIKQIVEDSTVGFLIEPTAIDKDTSFFDDGRRQPGVSGRRLINLSCFNDTRKHLSSNYYSLPTTLVDSLDNVLVYSNCNSDVEIFSDEPLNRFNGKIFDTDLNHREMEIHLPTSYFDSEVDQTPYPVLYFLHGANNNHLSSSYDILPELMKEKMESGELPEMILVEPDGSAAPYLGSFYTDSELYGNIETMIAEVFPREIESALSVDTTKSCIMGHSMGGFGAMKIGLKYPNQFDCIISHSGPLDLSQFPVLIDNILEEQGGEAPYNYNPFSGTFSALSYSVAGALSPNLDNTDQPVDWVLDENGEIIPEVFDKWMEENPARLIRSFKDEDELPVPIYFDVGLRDELEVLVFNDTFSDSLNKHGFRGNYFYETYAGGHQDQLAERFAKSLQWIQDGFDTGIFAVPTEIDERPNAFTLSQNYPNPFNPSTNISFTLPQANEVSLKVFNLLGQEVANLVNERKSAGTHTVNFDASGLSSGVYIYQLIAGEQIQTKKMILIK